MLPTRCIRWQVCWKHRRYMWVLLASHLRSVLALYMALHTAHQMEQRARPVKQRINYESNKNEWNIIRATYRSTKQHRHNSNRKEFHFKTTARVPTLTKNYLTTRKVSRTFYTLFVSRSDVIRSQEFQFLIEN